ncbi:TPA: hypothetical protein PR856_002098 [Staphylococcus aureus]|uniref:hypothetical protein n=1 Tax=Staphylococcus TaxID=1279 RepID=UPI0022960C24|nr:hypothetical protein [Staphylococcus epidermidis]HCW0036301.1 hypothetical protein [Staphylococcus aureus]MCG1566851.1 hypothetical protein [Staphylococcus epidermidis]HCW0039082.1 hypothetical protein [Staphylococcus aureus]HDA5091099.1 hypothetical protein [Staphylococcus aureus]HDB3374726.1 hypothetical protein [Staphylococcus aureus]
MNDVIEFFKSIFTNPQTVKLTFIMTVVLAISWYIYQTIADTNSRRNTDKFRKTYLGQLITGKSPEDNPKGKEKVINEVENKKYEDDVKVDMMIVKALRTKVYKREEFSNKNTSRGYDALATYEDLNRILKYNRDIKRFVKEAKGNLQSQNISSFRVKIIESDVIIHSLTIPPMKMTYNQAMNLNDVDSMKGIINDNRILSAFAFDY